MAEAKANLGWEQTGQIALLIAAANRKKGSRKLTMEDFNPLRAKMAKRAKKQGPAMTLKEIKRLTE